MPGALDGNGSTRGSVRARGVKRRGRVSQEWSGDRSRVGEDFGKAARSEHPAAVAAGAGADVDEEIGCAHHALIVLHHHDGVAVCLQTAQGPEQAAGVAWVQADGRFIEDIADAEQAATQVGGQAARCSSPPERVGAGRSSVR